MRNFINKLFIGFMSGLISAGVLLCIFTLIRQQSITLDDAFKFQLYKLMVWGGVWAILFAFPISNKILIKSSFIGFAVIFFNFIVLMPLQGKGFFALDADMVVFVMNIVFNYLWALLAGLIYIKVER